MTRIVAGTRGGRRLATPPGRATRPTSDRVREALFSALDATVGLVGCRFADLYAGSGAVGLEAASRGAASVLLVESDPRAVQVLRANVAALGLGEVCRVVAGRVSTALATPPAEVDRLHVAFADPPYQLAEAELGQMIAALVPWLAPGAVVVIERSSRAPEPTWAAGITRERSRRYGDATLWYGRRA